MNSKFLAIIASLIVLAAVVAAFLVVGSPAHQRDLNFDQRRVSDLQSIQSETVNYWQQKAKLPSQLSDLTNSISGFKAPMDPETGNPYEYIVKSGLNFQLCADFKLPSANSNQSRAIPMMYPYDNWDHAAGHVCFDRTIDPQLYKPISTPPIK